MRAAQRPHRAGRSCLLPRSSRRRLPAGAKPPDDSFRSGPLSQGGLPWLASIRTSRRSSRRTTSTARTPTCPPASS
ncbi:MAG: hypothetical protein ACK56F_28850, partial [bacterium]